MYLLDIVISSVLYFFLFFFFFDLCEKHNPVSKMLIMCTFHLSKIKIKKIELSYRLTFIVFKVTTKERSFMKSGILTAVCPLKYNQRNKIKSCKVAVPVFSFFVFCLPVTNLQNLDMWFVLYITHGSNVSFRSSDQLTTKCVDITKYEITGNAYKDAGNLIQKSQNMSYKN